MPKVTGIPLHIAHMQQINNVKDACEEIKTEIKGIREDFKAKVHEAFDEKVESSDGLNTALWTEEAG